MKPVLINSLSNITPVMRPGNILLFLFPRGDGQCPGFLAILLTLHGPVCVHRFSVRSTEVQVMFCHYYRGKAGQNTKTSPHRRGSP